MLTKGAIMRSGLLIMAGVAVCALALIFFSVSMFLNNLPKTPTVQDIQSLIARLQHIILPVGTVITGIIAGLFIILMRSRGGPRVERNRINNTAEQLGTASAGMTFTSAQMTADIDQMSQQSSLIAAKNERISQEIQHMSIATEEVVANIREISSNVNNVNERMTHVTRAVKTAAATFAAFQEQSEQIGSVVNTITAVAQETNLLALNATIEAARAGESGRGFAVVAQEVKNLAFQTADLARNITQEIASIQTSSSDANQAMDEVNVMTTEVSEFIQAIAASLVQQNSAIENFSHAVADAVIASQDITYAMNDISAIAHDSSEQARHVQDASLKLLLLADQLNYLVDVEKGLYNIFEAYKRHARTGKPYPEKPGKGKRLAFGNNAEAYFCYQVQESLVKQAKLAGFKEDDLLLLNNNFDARTGLENADRVLKWKPDIFVEFQADSEVNERIGQMFRQAHIPVLAIDIAIPRAPIIGTDNYGVAIAAGCAMVEQITTKFGGLEQVDLIILLQIPESGEAVMLRSEGVIDVLQQQFGAENISRKIVRIDGGIGNEQEAERAMSDVLTTYPTAARIAFTGVTDQMVKGAIDALHNANRWDPANIIAVPLGLDSLGQQLLREGLADVGVAFFPERYGEIIIPAVLTMLKKQPVPERMYVENAIIRRQELEQFYPRHEK